MTTVTGSGYPYDLFTFAGGYIDPASAGPDGFTLGGNGILKVTVTGTGLRYDPPLTGTDRATALIDGSITGFTIRSSGSQPQQVFSNLNTPATSLALRLKVGDRSGVNALLLDGDGTFYRSGRL